MNIFGIPDFGDIEAFGKLVLVVSILLVFGILFLIGKVVVVPKSWSFVIGLGLVGGAVWLVYNGGF